MVDDPRTLRFWHAAVRSGLIDEARLETCWASLPEAKRTPDAADRRLARQTVAAGYLTLWQAQQLLGGRSTGYRLDRYVLLDHLGRGGMGRVFLARDTRLNRRVALKVLSPERMSNPRAIARFQREARVGAQLQHENLVRIYDEGDTNGVRFLVMEYIEGKTIGHLIAESGPIPYPTAARLARQVALGLEHARLKGLIHRDVNPWNILVTHEGIAKLTDLGLAIDLSDQQVVTREGATVGTFDYISPEQARHSHSVDTRSDIYSLGCTLYHMIAGRVPFACPSLPEKLYAHQMTDPDPLSALVPDLPEGLWAVVRRMLRKAPDERFATPREVAEALEPFAEGVIRDSWIQGVAGPRARGPHAPPHARASNPAQDQAPTPQGSEQPGSDGGSPEPVVTSASASSLSPSSSPSGEPPTEAITWNDSHIVLPPLNLDPAPPLASSLSAVHVRREAGEAQRVRWLWLSGGLGLVALAALMMAWEIWWPGGPSGESANASVTTAPESQPGEAAVPGVFVRWPDGRTEAIGDFCEALERAGGGRGRVVLDNREPLRLRASEMPETLPLGALAIEAASGTRAVLVVSMDGTRPFLLAPPTTPLTLTGLTIRAEYPPRETPEPPPPVILAQGNLSLDRCALTNTQPVQGARAVVASGLETTAQGCWFENFDRALEFAAYPGAIVRMTECMVVQTRLGDGPLSWGVKALLKTTQASGDRRLEIDRCTFQGGGLLELEGFTPEAPLTIAIQHTAVQAYSALLMCPPDLNRDAWHWSGQTNLYDIENDSWVVMPPYGSLPLPDAPTNLESWRQAASEDDQTRAEPILFATDPTSAAGPRDFALRRPRDAEAGARPDRIGPDAP